jgi:hypothetical protein
MKKQTCTNIKCGAEVWALYPDKEENSGKVCKVCFDKHMSKPKKKKVAPNLINFKGKKLPCKECRTRFVQGTPTQKYCSHTCSNKVSARAYRKRQKEGKA